MRWTEHSVDSPKSERILDFDIETLAGGYADPSWVPDKITAAAWSWVGSENIEVRCDPLGYFSREKRRRIIRPLLKAIEKADVVQGHNIVRFDLRVLSAECMRLGLVMPSVQYIDTIQLPKSKGFKKGQDDISVLLGIPLKKRTLNWQEWDNAYEEGAPWATVIERITGDVRQHKLLVREMGRRGWLRPKKAWRP